MKNIVILSVMFLMTSIVLINYTEFKKKEIEPKPALSESKLQVNVELSKSIFHLKDMGEVSVELKNIGESSFAIYKDIGWGKSSSLSYSITNSRGEIVIGKIINDSMDIPPFQKDKFVQLYPEQSITKKRWLDVGSEGINKIGEYRLNVYYHSPVPCDMAPLSLRIWAMEDGTVASQPISFTVIK